MSFIFVGIYWNNHHHLFQAIEKVNGKILWANLFLLFWLSLLPLSTGWMDEHLQSSWPVAVYGFVLLMCSISFLLIEKAAIKNEQEDSNISKSLSNRKKEIFTILTYVVSMITAFYLPVISIILYIITAIVWIVPDRRIEKYLN